MINHVTIYDFYKFNFYNGKYDMKYSYNTYTVCLYIVLIN